MGRLPQRQLLLVPGQARRATPMYVMEGFYF